MRKRVHGGDGQGLEPRWIKSSLSMSNGNCVEVARLPGGYVAVRDSKNNRSPVLCFSASEWQAFVGGVQNGEFDSVGGSQPRSRRPFWNAAGVRAIVYAVAGGLIVALILWLLSHLGVVWH